MRPHGSPPISISLERGQDDVFNEELVTIVFDRPETNNAFIEHSLLEQVNSELNKPAADTAPAQDDKDGRKDSCSAFSSNKEGQPRNHSIQQLLRDKQRLSHLLLLMNCRHPLLLRKVASMMRLL